MLKHLVKFYSVAELTCRNKNRQPKVRGKGKSLYQTTEVSNYFMGEVALCLKLKDNH